MDTLWTKNIPHILEKIFFSLDYQSYKRCFEVSNSWNILLKSESFQKKCKLVFRMRILGDEKKLHKACGAGDTSTVRRLLSYQMLNVNCMVKKTEDECTPLFEAAYWGHSEVVSILLDNGADPNIKCTYCISEPLWADGNPSGYPSHIPSHPIQTPLHRAAANGHTGMVQNLIDKGAEVDAADELGETSLYKAAGKGMMDVAQTLIDRGAKVNMTTEGGITPLHKAAVKGMKEMAQMLIDKGANVDMANERGETPLHMATENGMIDVVQVLIDSGANLRKRNKRGDTLMEVAHDMALLEKLRRPNYQIESNQVFQLLREKEANYWNNYFESDTD